jgi:hypothetical protein
LGDITLSVGSFFACLIIVGHWYSRKKKKDTLRKVKPEVERFSQRDSHASTKATVRGNKKDRGVRMTKQHRPTFESKRRIVPDVVKSTKHAWPSNDRHNNNNKSNSHDKSNSDITQEHGASDFCSVIPLKNCTCMIIQN